jgi:hypothetical protein
VCNVEEEEAARSHRGSELAMIDEGEPCSAHGGPVLCAPPTPPFPAPQSALSYNLPWRTLDLAKPLESLLRCS